MDDTAHLPKILVLEDEWMIAEQIEGMLGDLGFEVVGPIGRVEQALALLDEQRIDAALLDINVNGTTTYAVAKRLVEADIPFLFLTGYAAADLPGKMGARPLLQKPVNARILRQAMMNLLNPGAARDTDSCTQPPGVAGRPKA
jgi:CheY-like chemotaxis protein